jgi:hypothetical protein
MSGERKPSRDYSTMSREEAQRHFANRELDLKNRISALSTAEKFRLVADFLDAGDKVAPALPLNVARLALAELEARS